MVSGFLPESPCSWHGVLPRISWPSRIHLNHTQTDCCASCLPLPERLAATTDVNGRAALINWCSVGPVPARSSDDRVHRDRPPVRNQAPPTTAATTDNTINPMITTQKPIGNGAAQQAKISNVITRKDYQTISDCQRFLFRYGR